MPDDGVDPVRICRYRCPLCGKREQRLAVDDGARKRIENELANHVEMSDDDVHGGQYSVPDADTLDDVGEYVEVRPLGD